MTTSSFCGGTTALSSINLDDTSLRQVRTAYYGGMNSTKRNVRRNLFGVINEEKKNQVDEWLDEKMAEINAEVAEKAKYWAFDFTQNTPIINSNESDYRWIACRCTDVPEFYLNRNSYDIVCDSNEDEECCKFRPIPVCVNNESADSSFVAVEENVPCTSVGVCPPDLLKNLPIVGVDDAVNSSTPEKGNEIAQSPTIPPVVQKKSQTQLTNYYPQRKRSAAARSLRSKLSPGSAEDSSDLEQSQKDIDQCKKPRVHSSSSSSVSSSPH